LYGVIIMTGHIFVSYSHEDGDSAEILRREIEAKGFAAWMDEDRLSAGDNWREEIDQAIREAAALIVVISPSAKDSEYVTYEWAFALGVGIRVIPVLLKHTELHPRLKDLHYLDFTNRKARPWDKLFENLHNAQKFFDSYAVHIPEDSSPYIKNIAAKISSHKWTERENAIDTLGENDDSKAFEILLNALKSPMRDVRACAAMALGNRKDRAAVPALIEALNDENEEVSENAAWALGMIGTPEAKDAVDKWKNSPAI